MRTSTVASVLVAVAGAGAQRLSTRESGVANVVTNNPAGAAYIATLPETAFDKKAYPNGGNVKGYVYATSSPDGAGVIFQAKFSNLPTEGGPFTYHIHDKPVPADGNCTSTAAHLDPYGAGDTTECDAAHPETCQVGDLAGKYGKVKSDPFVATYTDDYSSLLAGTAAYFGNLSIVVHYPNKTRITCANFAPVIVSGTGSGSCTGSGSGSPPPSATTGVSYPTGTGGLVPSGVPSTSNGTITTPKPSPSPTSPIVQAGAANKAPTLALAIGAAVLAFTL